MGASDGRSDADRVVAWARDFERRITRLCNRISRLEESLAELEFDFKQFVHRLSGAPGLVLQGRRPPRHMPGPDDFALVVSSLVVARQADESAYVRIDGSEPIKLARALANLLEALARERVSSDHLVGWKPIDVVVAELSAREQRPVGRRAVINRMWQLRTALLTAGLSAGFVQSHPDKGVRFAKRATPAHSPGADSAP
jgi:hypothetical protein